MDAIDRASEMIDAGLRPIPLGAMGETPPPWFFKRYEKESPEEVVKKWPKTPRVAWGQFRGDNDIWPAIEDILSKAPANCNLGLVTGQGVVVIDADDQDQIDFVLDNLERTPYRVKTGKGMHFYYRQPTFETRNFQAKHGIDFRGVGGYVVAHGSIHHTGVLYTEEVDEDFEGFGSLPVLTMADFTKAANYGAVEVQSPIQPKQPTEITFDPVGEGSRNNTAAQLVGKAIREGHSLSTIKQLLDSWNESLPDPLSLDELNMTIASVAKTHTVKGGAPIDLVGGVEAPPIETMDQFDAQAMFEDLPIEETKWLVKGTFEVSKPYVIAAEGDTGKSFSLLNLAIQVAMDKSEFHNQQSFGGLVEATGKVLVLSAEDNRNDINRRLSVLMEEMGVGWSDMRNRLKVIPVPDLEKDYTLIGQGPDGAQVTKTYEAILQICRDDGEYAMIVVDTLQSLVDCEIQSDNRVAQYVAKKFVSLSSQTGATVLLSHHFNRGRGEPIKHPTDARDRIRGATGLVDGTRGTYTMWKGQIDEAMNVCEMLNEDYWTDRIVFGGLAKSNGEAKKVKHTYLRSERGYLQDVTARVATAREADELSRLMLCAIRYAAKEGHPYTLRGATGIYENRETLPSKLQEISKHGLNDMANKLITEGRIVKHKVEGAGRHFKWLDVVSGVITEGYEIKPAGRLKPYDEQAIWAQDEV